MNLITISGFLGSGKTTILLSIAKYLSEQENKKVAIIENEVGDIGVDGVYLKQEGLQLKEIYSGCICCSLRNDIIQTLLELEREYQPDVVLLEPSGVANPVEVQRCLNGYGGEIDYKQNITVIDPVRFYTLRDFSAPLISNSIEHADTVIINKTDLVTDEEIYHLTERIQNINKSVNILSVSTLLGNGLDEVCDNLSTEITQAPEPGFVLDLPKQEVPTHLQATTFATKIEVKFEEAVPVEEIKNMLASYLSEVSSQLIQHGCNLIGHLKVIAKEKNKGYLMASKTSFEHAPHIKGKLAKSLSSITYTTNLIVYGVHKNILENIGSSVMNSILLNKALDSASGAE